MHKKTMSKEDWEKILHWYKWSKEGKNYALSPYGYGKAEVVEVKLR